MYVLTKVGWRGGARLWQSSASAFGCPQANQTLWAWSGYLICMGWGDMLSKVENLRTHTHKSFAKVRTHAQPCAYTTITLLSTCTGDMSEWSCKSYGYDIPSLIKGLDEEIQKCLVKLRFRFPGSIEQRMIPGHQIIVVTNFIQQGNNSLDILR